MKGFVKAIIAGAIILGIGIAVLIIALGVNGWTFSPKFETEEFTATQDNTALSVILNAGKLKIEYRDDDSEEIDVSYPVMKGYETTITESDGTFRLENNSFLHGFTGCNVSCGIWTPETVVKIPKDKITEISVTLKAGTFELKQGTFEKVDINVHAGACYVENITCSLLQIDVNAGALHLDAVNTDKLICDVSAGAATINKIDCPLTEIEVSAGAANVKFVGAKADYTATVNVSAGSCNGLTTQSGGDKNITVRVSAGSCNVNFTD